MSIFLIILLSFAVIFFIIGCIGRAAGWAPWFTISLGCVIAYLAIPVLLKG